MIERLSGRCETLGSLPSLQAGRADTVILSGRQLLSSCLQSPPGQIHSIESSRNKQFIQFKLYAILSNVITFNATPAPTVLRTKTNPLSRIWTLYDANKPSQL